MACWYCWLAKLDWSVVAHVNSEASRNVRQTSFSSSLSYWDGAVEYLYARARLVSGMVCKWARR